MGHELRPAALSTLLTYDFKDNTPESAIVAWILHRVSPVKVRNQGGFSLLDLKHFAQAVLGRLSAALLTVEA